MNVIITGCSRGIGKAILETLLLIKPINKVYALSSSIHKIEQSDKVIPVEVDFLKEDWIHKVKDVIKEDPIHIIINNAGYLFNGLIGETPKSEIDKMFAVNYYGPLNLVENCLDNIKKGKAHIINIGSMGGFSGSSKFPGLSIYSSSKAALANLSECWAEELKEFGVKSNCLALGAVNTEMLNNAFPGYVAPVNADLMAKKIVDFAINYGSVINGKIIPFSVTTP